MSPKLDLYLIAHKVRGEPAFDIATCEEVEGETMWIIPTSGHRAYPYWYRDLLDLGIGILPDGCWAYGIDPVVLQCEGLIPIPTDDWPDHYSVSASPHTADPTAARDLLSSLGLLKPAEPIKRRI